MENEIIPMADYIRMVIEEYRKAGIELPLSEIECRDSLIHSLIRRLYYENETNKGAIMTDKEIRQDVLMINDSPPQDIYREGGEGGEPANACVIRSYSPPLLHLFVVEGGEPKRRL